MGVVGEWEVEGLKQNCRYERPWVWSVSGKLWG